MERSGAELVLGIPFRAKSIEVLIQEAVSAIERKRPPVVFACANPHSIVTAQDDACFREALLRADHLVVDGSGLAIMAHLSKIRVGPRITGTDYYLSVMRALEGRGGGRVFFFGSSTKVLELIVARMHRDFPRVDLCGAISPPFRPWSVEENALMVEQINAAKPDVLWVGMTAPKQETWVQANRHLLTVPLIGSIGAVFDFYAGTHSRAPEWMCRCGIEWIHRLIREPRRMWRRNFVSSPRFIALMVQRHILGAQRGLRF